MSVISSRATAKKIVYVVVNNGLNSRIRALTELRGPGVEVVYVTSVKVNVAPAPNLVVEPYKNPVGILRKLGLPRLKRILDSVLYFPTREKLYVAPVVNKLKGAIERHVADGMEVVVLTCAPPHALCLVGKRLKAAFPSIRWVIDWQDLWSWDESYFDRVFVLYRARARRLEREVMHQTDVNVTTNHFAKRAIEDLYCLDPGRVMAIAHHFQRADRKAQAPAQATGIPATTRRIVFMGGMFKPPKVPGEKFLEALKKVRAESPIDVELHLYGRQGAGFEEYKGREREYGFTWHGVVRRDQVLNELRQYDYQLLLLEDLPNSRLIMHLKLPEYLVAGPPILAIVPRSSAVEEIINVTGTGYVIPADSDWVQQIRNLVEGKHTMPCGQRNEQEIERFAWHNVKEQWKCALGVSGRSVAPASEEKPSVHARSLQARSD